MKIIKTRKGQEVFIDDKYFDELNKFVWAINTQGYAFRHEYVMSRKQSRETGLSRKKLVLMHRLIMQKEGLLDAVDKRHIDHVDRVRINNQVINLRVCEDGSSTNAINAKVRADNSSGYKGVSAEGNSWWARVQFKGKRISAGYYKTKEEAALAYNKKALELHGSEAFLNVVNLQNNA